MSVYFTFQQYVPTCATCTNPANVVMKRENLLELLESARKLTHPDVCPSEKATEVTAQINACIDAIRPR